MARFYNAIRPKIHRVYLTIVMDQSRGVLGKLPKSSSPIGIAETSGSCLPTRSTCRMRKATPSRRSMRISPQSDSLRDSWEEAILRP